LQPQIVENLAECGLQSSNILLRQGYPDIGWSPVEGERYLDFLKHAVFVNGRKLLRNGRLNETTTLETRKSNDLFWSVCNPGESVEENANLVVRLLIRRPECFGPSLRGEGGEGLLSAITEALQICRDPHRDGPDVKFSQCRWALAGRLYRFGGSNAGLYFLIYCSWLFCVKCFLNV